MNKTAKSWWLLIPYALAYGVIMISLGGFHLYEQSPYHRYQAEALLHGHFWLADSINTLQPGLACHNGHVQQVWGLGIGLWLLPFEGVWRLFNQSPFPDRIALGLAFALLAFFSGATGMKLIREGRRQVGAGVLSMIVLCPALWTLARASQLVFEETVLYSVILSLAILISLIRVVSFGLLNDYFFCCCLSSFAVWIRPPHAVYGLAAIAIASLTIWISRHSFKLILAGTLLWPASLALLAWTNCVRFGSPSEFGHHLTVSTGSMMFLTRFGNPCHEASFLQAAKELFSLLFFANPQGANAFAENQFPGQFPFVRWRRLDLSTFDLSWIILIMVVVIISIVYLVRQRRREFPDQPQQKLLIAGILFWSIFSTVMLYGFYLYYPAMASRYLLDFAPAFVGFVLLAGMLSPKRWAKFVIPLLVIWLVLEISSAKVPADLVDTRPAIQLALPQTEGVPVKDFTGLYMPENHPAKTRISGNGYGWDPDSGIASDVVSVAVDDPQFIELRLSVRRQINGMDMGKDMYQAQIDGLSLPLHSITNDNDQIKVLFDVPEKIKHQRQQQFLFLCFSKGYGQSDRNSERFLYSIRWK